MIASTALSVDTESDECYRYCIQTAAGSRLTARLDSLDRQIIGELRRDGTQANTDIARRLGVSETTIRSRVRRLVNEGVVRIAAAVNLSRLGYDLHVFIGVHCSLDRMPAVMSELASILEVRNVSAVSGEWDLLLTASFESKAAMYEFLTERLGAMPGVMKTEVLHVLREVKRDYFFWETRALPPAPPLEGDCSG